LLRSISHSTERISELVRAVKSYSFMDQATWQEIDVHEGIENTLIMLGHKLRNVTSHATLTARSRASAHTGGELNQVWTNLIDNAIYTVGGTDRIDIPTRRDGESFLLRSPTMAAASRPRPSRISLQCPCSQQRAAQVRDLAWSSATGSSSNGIMGKTDFSTGLNGTQFNVRLPFESPAHV
jgi:signal transduction histidine kinase